MGAAHICIRSALAQAFRPSHGKAGAVFSVPAFLVPACACSPRRPFSSARQARAQLDPSSRTTVERPIEQTSRRRGGPARTPRRIPFPIQDDSADIRLWLHAFDPFLPPHLRHLQLDEPDISASVTPLDLALFLNAAQDASLDILSHLGLVDGRWDTVVWIAKKLVEDGKQSFEPPVQLEVFANSPWSISQPQSLDELTNNPPLMQPARLPKGLAHTSDDITARPETIELSHRIIKRGLGQLWRSLGNMILVAAEEDSKGHETSMHRVLEIIAYLHHMGLIPESVYRQRPMKDDLYLQQPPTLHLLSSKILTALSDATWRAHEASVKVATERLNASYFLGHEIPGSRYKVQVTQVAPELWLELVLWSCLHGGWIVDGSAILERLATHQGDHSWGLVSWRELLQTKDQEPDNSSGWSLFQRRVDATETAQDREKTRRTISSEVVSAFVDALVNTMRLGVGDRGTKPEELVERINRLKRLLDLNSLGLGSATWDSIMARLLESGGIVPEKRPELLLSILDLATEFGTEVNTLNARPKADMMNATDLPYFYEATTIPLSLLHWTLRSFIANGDLAGAMTTLRCLQQYTDSNKQRSLEQFFETLKDVPLRHDEPFTSRLPPIEFPAFENRLPLPLLAKLLDLVTDTKMYELGRWFLFSQDVDGPLIQPWMYPNWDIAAAVIRFGTVAGENDLVLKIIKKTRRDDKDPLSQRLPHELVTVLLCSQIQVRRWQSVRNMQDYISETPGYRPQPQILATFAAELVRCSGSESEADPSVKEEARDAFKNFLYSWENLVLTHLRNELYCILAILSAIHNDWKEYCSEFLAYSSRQDVGLSVDDFNQLLGGILDGHGSSKGRDMVDMWCYAPPKTFEPYRAPGGLPTMPKYRTGKGEEYESHPEDVEIIQSSGAKLILQGRVHPNRQTAWAVLRKVQQEEDERRQRGEQASIVEQMEVRETLRWAARLLYYLGFDYEDIVRDLGSLADQVELEAPPAPAPLVGRPEHASEPKF